MYGDNESFSRGSSPISPEAAGAARALRAMAGMLRKGILVVSELNGGSISDQARASIENDAALLAGYAGQFERRGDSTFAAIEKIANEPVETSVKEVVSGSVALVLKAMLQSAGEGDGGGLGPTVRNPFGRRQTGGGSFID